MGLGLGVESRVESGVKLFPRQLYRRATGPMIEGVHISKFSTINPMVAYNYEPYCCYGPTPPANGYVNVGWSRNSY